MRNSKFGDEKTPWDRETVENRYGLQIAGLLTQSSFYVPHDMTERLRVARERALEAGRWAQQVRGAPTDLGGGVLALGGEAGWGWRFASVLPAVALAVGMFFIQDQNDSDQVHAAADIDAALLADDLPPDAYADVGFAEFLRRQDR